MNAVHPHAFADYMTFFITYMSFMIVRLRDETVFLILYIPVKIHILLN